MSRGSGAGNSGEAVGLSRFVEETTPKRTLRLQDRNAPEALRRLFANAFRPMNVDADTHSPDDGGPASGAGDDSPGESTDRAGKEGVAAADRHQVVLLEDGDVVERSPLQELLDAFLLVNSDWYKTRTNQLEVLSVPTVLSALEGTVFRLQSYPRAHREKLLLILLSRHIEQIAYEGGRGTLRTGFQELSRVDDEWGTKEVYRTLASGEVEVHLYGVPDASPNVGTATVHTGTSADYSDSWFVVYRPTGESVEAGRHAALVAYRSDDAWRGNWTFDAERVCAIDDYLDRNL